LEDRLGDIETIVVTVCMDSSSESWEPQLLPQLWHSRAGGGAVHSIKVGSPGAQLGSPLYPQEQTSPARPVRSEKCPQADISRVVRSRDPSYNISSVGLRAMVQERPVRVERRLSAIVAADVAGYSRLMHNDEEATHAKLAALLTDAVAPAIAEHGGRIFKNTGDGFLAEFPSAVDAVRAAVQFQARIKELTIAEPEDGRIGFRVGINVGDVIVEPNDIFGDGVNIAARL
jgi:class 3 adenylate cyclase